MNGEFKFDKEAKVWFKWPNGQLQKVFIYRSFQIEGETCYRGVYNKRFFVLKSSEYGKTWASTPEELEAKK